MPEAYLRCDGQVMRDYESTELAVKEGEMVTAVLEESGWIPKKVVR